MNTLWSTAEGFASGCALADMKRVEDSVRQGQNHTLTGVHQAGQVYEGLEQVARLLKAANYSPLSFSARWVLILSPLVLAYSAAQHYGGQNLYPIYDHIGTLCQIASVVTSVALVYFGQIAFGVASIALVGIGFLDRNGILPPDMRRVIHITTYPIFLITGLLVGGLFTKIFVGLNIATIALNAILGTRTSSETVAPETNSVSPEALNLLDYQPLEINPLHLRYCVLPPIPDVDIQRINTLCDAIDWHTDSNQQALRTKLDQDARWRERYRGRIDSDIYMRGQLRSFIDSIQNRTILEGEPVNYEELHNYLRIIADRLPQLDEFSRADILLKLALDGGEYCGPGKFGAVSDAYLSVLSDEAGELPLEKKILTHLQMQRIRIFQALYDRTEKASPLNQALAGTIDHLDQHNYNLYVNLFGAEFGLPNQGASEDAAAHVDPILLAAFSRTSIRQHFLDEYTSDFIISSLQEAIGTPALPLPDIYAWWESWIVRQTINDSEKTALHQELSIGQLLGRHMESPYFNWVDDHYFSRRTLSEHLIKAMLLEIGILKYPDPLQDDLLPAATLVPT